MLLGIVLAFVMQHNTIQTALSNAVYLRGKIADLLVEKESTVLDVRPTKLIDSPPKAFHALSENH